MEYLDLRLSDTILKFCEKNEYAESIAQGDIYMKESGYFRKIDDTFRGDYYDGRIPVRWKAEKIPIRLSDGKTYEIEGINEDVYGTANDEKVPMFCATMLDGCIVDEPEDGITSFICKESIQEMSQFGKYVVCFSLEEFMEKIQIYTCEYDLRYRYAKVSYFDIFTAYSSLYFESPQKNSYLRSEALFFKDTHYRWQNEWRLVLLNDGINIIPDDRDYHIMQLGMLESARIYKAENLFKMAFLV